MGEFAAKFRPEVDLDEFERRLRAAAPLHQPRPEDAGDPLAELARLVNSEAVAGRTDPFEALFRAQSAVAEERDAAQARLADEPPAVAPFGLREPYFGQLRGSDGHLAAEAAQHEYAHPDETYGYADEAYAADPLPYRESAADWAEATRQETRDEQARDEQAWPTAFGEAALAEPAPRIRRKVMYGMAVIMAVGVVGVAGLLTLRHRSANHEVVTIQPDSAPARVAPAQVEGASAPEGQGLFDHKGGNGVAKVVAGAEQPADLKAAVNNAQTAAGAASVATPAPPTPSDQATQGPQTDSLFPPARKVRTVAVRADGSVIGAAGAGAPLPVTSVLPTMAASAPPPEVTAAPTSEPAAKSTQRAHALTASAPTAAAHAKAPKASNTPKASNAPKPAAVQEAARASGAYAVQLSGEPNEADARAAAKRLSAKYSGALEGRHAVPVKASIGSRTVWRVRVGHLSEEKAKSMCGAVKSSGGSCFIARD
jgi:SPOR domain